MEHCTCHKHYPATIGHEFPMQIYQDLFVWDLWCIEPPLVSLHVVYCHRLHREEWNRFHGNVPRSSIHNHVRLSIDGWCHMDERPIGLTQRSEDEWHWAMVGHWRIRHPIGSLHHNLGHLFESRLIRKKENINSLFKMNMTSWILPAATDVTVSLSLSFVSNWLSIHFANLLVCVYVCQTIPSFACHLV